MRISWVALAVGIVLAFAPAASGGGTTTVRTTLKGTCTLENRNNSIGTALWSIVTCDAAGTCACRGTTKLVFHTESKYPATSEGGREKGLLTATNAEGTVTVSLAGKRETAVLGHGTWTLGKVIGYSGFAFRKRGTYTVSTRELSAIVGTTSTNVQIKTTIVCLYCRP